MAVQGARGWTDRASGRADASTCAAGISACAIPYPCRCQYRTVGKRERRAKQAGRQGSTRISEAPDAVSAGSSAAIPAPRAAAQSGEAARRNNEIKLF